MSILLFVLFFKQKTAYEMRISDWSSDVCSSDLYDEAPPPPSPGFGDSLGAMTIAGGIMGALFHREKTGTATTVDVSLLSTGLWAMGQAIALSDLRSEEHTSELQSLMRISYAVFCLKKKNQT